MDTSKATPRPDRYHPNGPLTYAQHGYFTEPGEEPWSLSISQGPRIVATVTGTDENHCRLRAGRLCSAVNQYDAHRQLVQAARQAHKFLCEVVPGADERRALERALAAVDQAVKP